MKIKLATILSAITGGLLLTYLNIPAGAMVGAMLGTALIQVKQSDKMEIPLKVRRIVRMMMGAYVGLGITEEGIRQVHDIIWPAVMTIVGMILLTLVTMIMLHKLYGWDLKMAILSSTPAGLSEIGMNAEDFQTDPVPITTVHLFRLVTILVTVPIILKLLGIIFE
ncbi:MAG: AbrB family transcriptional regulator [Dehalobacterium sp.]